MRQTDIFEFLDELSKLAEEESTSSTEQDETPTKVDEPPEASNTLIEDVITHYLEQCLDAGVVPSLDDAKSIAILDAINRSYK
jgi:hypothetical protein